jgi:Fe-S-cluster-containing hydrogenase component 2/CRP-like cAMP-binding protein
MAGTLTFGLDVDEEAFYARGVDGHLIRVDDATHRDMTESLELWVDGEKVSIWKAVPSRDDQGRVRRDSDGELLPRLATIYDAVAQRYQPLNYLGQSGSSDATLPLMGGSRPEGLDAPTGQTDPSGGQPDSHRSGATAMPVPTLCHQEHLTPVAVCRVCLVLVSRNQAAEGRLVPACKTPVQAGLEVHTSASREHVTFSGRPEPVEAGKFVKRAVRPVVELLALDHLHDREDESLAYENQLLRAANSLGVKLREPSDFAKEPAPRGSNIIAFMPKVHDVTPRLTDLSSSVIQVNRANCILCDRCVRSCRDVKPFAVIAHTVRGHQARITFDFDDPMGQSGCVSCGECAISCPTGALSFRGTVYQNRDPWADHHPKPETVAADELRKHPLFERIPYAFLKWNEGAVGRLKIPEDHKLCEKGQFGSTAFLIEKGAFEVDLGPGKPVLNRVISDGLIGEMACMNNQVRNATVRAKVESQVLVIRRNMLHMLRRNKAARDLLEDIYRERVLEDWMLSGKLFDGFSAERTANHFEALKKLQIVENRQADDKQQRSVTFVRVDPKEVFIRQGDRADSVYVVLAGHVEVAEVTPSGTSHVLAYMRKGESFGEIGVLSAISEKLAALLPERLRGRRTSACKALDNVELIRISKGAIEATLKSDEQLEEELVNRCIDMINGNRSESSLRKSHLRDEFTRQGLYEGQSLFIVDLEKCTRCLECVKACSDSHHGQTRIVFERERFDKYLVPAACRSCHDPECLNGCPVDAIHRRPLDARGANQPTLAVFIEDHCIGCGLCAYNCPFDSIQMYDLPVAKGSPIDRVAGPARIARNCDLCESVGGTPRCVYACPHDAAKRVPGHWLTDSLQLNMVVPAFGEPRG